MFEGQPKGLWTLALANTGERFGYYTMLAVFALFLGENFGFSAGTASEIYTWFLTAVYFLPLIGGMAADRWGYSKMVVIGILIMFFGYLLLSVPLGSGTVAIAAMGGALLLVSLGTGLFKGNLQVMVGDLYNAPEFASKRDSGFSLFYMAINVGALFAPTAAIEIMDWAQTSLGYSKADSYHFAFAVACVSVIVSILIYFIGRSTYKQVLTVKKDKAASANEKVEEMSPAETRERIICLCLVFAVVIFFWMAFHQNGLTLTWFADEFTARSATGITGMEFNVVNLIWCILIVYGLFGLFQGSNTKGKDFFTMITLAAGGLLLYRSNLLESDTTNLIAIIVAITGLFCLRLADSSFGKVLSALLIFAPAGILLYSAFTSAGEVVTVDAPIFQQFNPCFVVALTPVSIALFGWLAKKGKEPKAPVKIGLGMLVAACAYLLMTVCSFGLPATDHPNHVYDFNPNLLVSTYLILTFAELLLSPIGISFVTKVAPPKYKGMMMGGWFVATALGNKLVSIPGHMWDMPLWIVWATLMGICILAALFIFSVIKKLNKVA